MSQPADALNRHQFAAAGFRMAQRSKNRRARAQQRSRFHRTQLLRNSDHRLPPRAPGLLSSLPSETLLSCATNAKQYQDRSIAVSGELCVGHIRTGKVSLQSLTKAPLWLG